MCVSYSLVLFVGPILNVNISPMEENIRQLKLIVEESQFS